ncbi:unnamed protein product [Clavelina lepadiformis]|uniref:Transmembrane protein 254 n=1 Tax=Clavelina lepadiformis TaxID=159417 RepID=A0ABP0GGD8_CLALP
MPTPEPNNSTYFRKPNIVVAVLLLAGMTMLHFGSFSPNSVPHAYLGPIGLLYTFLAFTHPWAIRSIYGFAVTGHIVGAISTLYLTKKKGISDSTTRFKWFIQTLIFGIGSSSLLKAYSLKKSN